MSHGWATVWPTVFAVDWCGEARAKPKAEAKPEAVQGAVLMADPSRPDSVVLMEEKLDGVPKSQTAEAPSVDDLTRLAITARERNPEAFKSTVRDVLTNHNVKQVEALGDLGRIELALALRTIRPKA